MERRRARTSARVAAVLAVAASTLCLVALDAPAADAVPRHGGPSNPTVEPWNPADAPATPPAVELTAACVRLAGGRLEAVFGYRNSGELSVRRPLAADGGEVGGNVIERTTWRGWPPRPTTTVEELGPQVTLFKPGDHPYAFAVRFRLTEQVAWKVHVPSVGGGDSGWLLTVRPRLLSWCGRDVPQRFAVVQHAPLQVGVVDVVTDPLGHVVGYGVEFDVAEIRVACSEGGEVFALRSAIGWPAGANLEPIEPDYLVQIPRSGEVVTFEMSSTTRRSAVDVFEPVEWLGPIADVSALCLFRNGTVGSDEFWAELAGAGRTVPVIAAGAVVDVDLSQLAPGASGLR
jgi:hypothetical protein